MRGDRKDGIRATDGDADRVRTGLFTDEMVKNRSKARGLTEPTHGRQPMLIERDRAFTSRFAAADLLIVPRLRMCVAELLWRRSSQQRWVRWPPQRSLMWDAGCSMRRMPV